MFSSVTEYAAQNEKHEADDEGLSKGGAVAVTFVVTVVVGLLIAGTFIGWRHHKSIKIAARRSESRDPLHPSTTGYDALAGERETSA